ncbi:MAG: hypothetical protein QMD04_07965 [Anaerolineales bacterium]|nr:hypothetical protein [Anaerolineales bacterium]
MSLTSIGVIPGILIDARQCFAGRLKRRLSGSQVVANRFADPLPGSGTLNRFRQTVVIFNEL